MTGRQIFSEREKNCLENLIVKHNISSSMKGGISMKREAWSRLVEEYNSISTNVMKTEGQLKKCWDNIKTRKRRMALALDKEQSLEQDSDPPGTAQVHIVVMEDGHLEQTEVEHNYSPVQLTPSVGGASDVSGEEFSPRAERTESREEQREEQLHRLRVEERVWAVRAAKETYYKCKLEKESAEEILRYNRTRRVEAELALKKRKGYI